MTDNWLIFFFYKLLLRYSFLMSLSVSLLLLLVWAAASDAQSSFPTNPTNNQRIPDKIVATGVSYTEQLIERHEGEEIILFCSWNVANQIIGVCINFSLCDNLTASDNLTFSYNLATAIEEFSNNFTITLEIFDVREDLSVIFSCFNDTTRVNGSLVPVILKRYFVKFQECNQTLPSNVIVNSISSDFGSEGYFGCRAGSTLFYQNGTQVETQLPATCNETANWSGEGGLQCLKAPDNVTLVGSFVVVEGSELSVHCQYDDVIPVGSTSLYFYDGFGIEVEKDKSFTTDPLSRKDFNKTISCQAVTSYTRRFNATGRSAIQFIDVRYAPYQTREIQCRFILNESEACNISFFANPKAEFVNLRRNGLIISNQGSFAQGAAVNEQIFHFTKTQVASADNGSYVLTVRSFVPPMNHEIEFTVLVFNTQLPTTQNSETQTPTLRNSAKEQEAVLNPTALIVGLVLGVLLFLSLVLFVMHYLKTRRKNQNFPAPTQSASNNAEAVHKTTDNTETQSTSTDSPATLPFPPLDKKTKTQETPPLLLPKDHDYVNLQNNVEVVEEENGYITLTALAPEVTPAEKPSCKIKDYESIKIKKNMVISSETKDGYVIMRNQSKFFNINDVNETKSEKEDGKAEQEKRKSSHSSDKAKEYKTFELDSNS